MRRRYKSIHNHISPETPFYETQATPRKALLGCAYRITLPERRKNIYQKFFHKVSCLREEFFREVIFQLNNLLKYKIFVPVK